MTLNALGIDVGGTGSRFVVIDEAGGEVARGLASGATGHLFAEAERKRFSSMVAEIAAQAPPAAAVHAGVTGLGPRASEDAHAIIAAAFGIPAASVTSSDDISLSFLATFAPGQGHLVSAGTGSIGLHIAESGEIVRVGGRGLLIDDGGSGTWITLTAIDRLYRCVDETGGVGEARELAKRLYEAVGGSAWDDVRSFVYGGDRGGIAELAPVVGAAAIVGDPLATEVLNDAVAELARLARALIGRTSALPVAFVGGVIGVSPMISAGLRRSLPNTIVSFPKVDAALQAARMARSNVVNR